MVNTAVGINQVRTCTGAAPITAAWVNIRTILDERARELFFEEPRKIELTRISCLFARTGKPASNDIAYTLDKFSDDNFFDDRIKEKTISIKPASKRYMEISI